MTHNADEYISKLSKIMRVDKWESFVAIYNGSQKDIYHYKDFKDLRDFCVSYYINNLFDWRPMSLTDIGILYWVSKNAIHKTVRNVITKINLYSYMLDNV